MTILNLLKWYVTSFLDAMWMLHITMTVVDGFTRLQSDRCMAAGVHGPGHDHSGGSRLVFKCCNGTAPKYLVNELFQPQNSGLEPTYDQHLRHHCLSVVQGCQPSAIKIFRLSLLVPGTFCHAMSHPHHLCQLTIAVWRPISFGCSFPIVVRVKWRSHYQTL